MNVVKLPNVYAMNVWNLKFAKKDGLLMKKLTIVDVLSVSYSDMGICNLTFVLIIAQNFNMKQFKSRVNSSGSLSAFLGPYESFVLFKREIVFFCHNLPHQLHKGALCINF